MMQNSDIVVGTLFMRAQKIIKDAQVLFFAPPMIPGYSASSDIELNMQDKTGGDLNHFYDVVLDYMDALKARPEINSAQTTFNPNFPQYMWMYNSYKSVLCTTEKHCSTTLPTSCRCSVLWKLLGLLIFILLPVQPFHLINKKTTFNYHLFVWQNRIYTSSCFQRGLHFID